MKEFRLAHLAMLLLPLLLVMMKASSEGSSSFSFSSNPAVTSSSSSADALEQAQELQPPTAQATLDGESEGAAFWETHGSLLRQAWKEWEEENQQLMQQEEDDDDDDPQHHQQYRRLPALNESAFDPTIRSAIRAAWKNPAKENEVEQLWTRIAPGVDVYKCQLFDPQRIQDIRKHIDAASTCGIPTRRPNGMNRFGLILDTDTQTDGAVSLQGFSSFLQDTLVDQYIRPMGRLLFSEYFGNPTEDCDTESYAFTIRYKQGQDVHLNEHSDASLVTLNVNLNLPEDENENDKESYEGSSIYFVDEHDKTKRHYVNFTPGTALMHRGMTRHAALPIKEGERTNLVVWLYGEHGYVRIAPYEKHERLSRRQRWQKPSKRQQQSSNHHHDDDDGGEL